jgi:Antitoxin SocA-like, Panacea domain
VAHDYDEDKFAELVLYVAGRIMEDPTGGATKINKILFAAECAHVRQCGSPITGAEYQKLPHGPAPRRLIPVRERLIADEHAELVQDEYMGYQLDRLKPRRPADTGRFSTEELKHVEQAIAALWGKTATEASELSHREMGWRMVELHETIPYEAALLAPRVQVTPEMRTRAEQLAALIRK